MTVHIHKDNKAMHSKDSLRRTIPILHLFKQHGLIIKGCAFFKKSLENLTIFAP